MRLKITCPKCHEESDLDIPLPAQSKGGKNRMAKVTPEQRKQYAQKALKTKKNKH